MVERDARLFKLSARQFGAFSRAQVLSLGFSRTEIQRRLSSRTWIKLCRAVYAVNGAPHTWEQRAMSGVLANGDAVVSHLAAAALWGLFDTKPDVVDITVRADLHHPRHRGIRVHRTSVLEGADRRTVKGVPVTSPNRTLVDLASVLPEKRLEAALDEAIRRGLVRVEPLVRFIDRCGRKRGIATLRKLLHDRAHGHTHSELEREFRRLAKRFELPGASRQFVVGPFKIDFAYDEERVLIELDGWTNHSTKSDLQADTRRQTELGAAKWYVLRFTWEDVTQRCGWVASQIRKALDR